jgi:hypothetical protein
MTQATDDRPKSQGRRGFEFRGLDCTYNLFRRSGFESLVCAVPVDRPVPGFLSGRGWLFDRALHPFDRLPLGFHMKAAPEAVRINGFYIFHLMTAFMPDPVSRGPASNAAIRAHVHAILNQLKLT